METKLGERECREKADEEEEEKRHEEDVYQKIRMILKRESREIVGKKI